MRYFSSARGALRATVITVLAVTSVSACGDGPSGADVSVPAVEFGPQSNVDTALRATPNGFSFANFGAGAAPSEEFDGKDLATMFGSGPEVCSSGTGDSCVPTAEAKVWAGMINESRQSGHCEGFVVQALSRFADRMSPDTSSLAMQPEVVHGIIRGFAAQFLRGSHDEARAWRGHAVRDIVAELVTSLRDGTPDYVLGVYGDVGGHAVLPHSVTFADAVHASIGIYDSNWPGQDRHVSVNLEDGTWAFSFDGTDPETDPNAWTGGKGGLDLSSLTSHTSGACPFCDSSAGNDVRATMLSIRAATWSVTTGAGTVTQAGGIVDGVDVTKVRAVQKKQNEWVVTVDPASFRSAPVALSLPKGGSAHVITPTAIARVAAGPKATATFDLTERSVSTDSRTASILLANGDDQVTATNKAATLSLDEQDVPVDRVVATTTVPASAVTGTAPRTQSTVTTVAGATTTLASPGTTAAPSTVPAPTTTTNSAPVVSSFSCSTASASELHVTVVASDANGDAMTYSFQLLSSPAPGSWFTPNPQTIANDTGQPTKFTISGGWIDGANTWRVSVSDGTASGTKSSTFTVDMMAGTC